jgi:hypothetical protein
VEDDAYNGSAEGNPEHFDEFVDGVTIPFKHFE